MLLIYNDPPKNFGYTDKIQMNTNEYIWGRLGYGSGLKVVTVDSQLHFVGSTPGFLSGDNCIEFSMFD